MSLHLPHDCLYWAISLTTKNGHLHCFLTTLPLQKLKTAYRTVKLTAAAGKDEPKIEEMQE